MTQDKLPYMQLYVRDWLTDPAVKKLSFSTKGFWIDLLFYLWLSDTRGKFVGTYKDISKLMGCNSDIVEKHILRLKEAKTANVTIANGIITIENRRILREEKKRMSGRIRSSRHIQKKELSSTNAKLTLESSEIRNHISDIRAIWNETFKNTTISIIELIRKKSSRERKLIIRIKEEHFRNSYKKAINKILESDFLKGNNSRGWTITFDWFITNDNNYIKILEGNYDNKAKARSTIKGESNYNESKL